jgi:hypothetical protein
MTRPRIIAAILGLGLVAASVAPALAQSTVIVPAPSASPTTVITPSQSGTTVVVPPGSTVTVQPPPSVTTTAVVPVKPWCAGEYGTPGGTNFGSCPGNLPR